jgi:serine protease Do
MSWLKGMWKVKREAMNRTIITFIILTSLLTTLSSNSAANTAFDQQKIFDQINSVLVTVEYKAEMTFLGQSDKIEGRVMGISIEPEGMIIFDGTTLGPGSHFGAEAIGAPRVEKPTSLEVIDYKGTTYDAEYIGVDQYSSIAFCRLPDDARIATAKFEDVDLSLGEEIYLFWMLPENFEPRFQMAQTPITGILDKPEKYYLTGELTSDFIMAPAVTAAGKILGVITPVTQIQNRYPTYDNGRIFGNPVGVMPLDQFRKLLAKPPVPGEFKRGWMGIALQALDPEIASFWDIDIKGGIIASDVMGRSPAEKAGLKPGDFLIELDNEPLEIKDAANLAVFQKMVSELGAGAEISLTVIRPYDEKIDTLYVEVILGDRPVSPSDAPAFEDINFDITVRDMVFADYNLRNVDPDNLKGVVVDKLEPGGWAAVGGVGPGDIIKKINGRIVESVDDCKETFAEIETDKKREVVFLVWRNHKTKFVNVKAHWK